MNQKQWNEKHKKVGTTFQWIAVVPAVIFLILSDLPFWQGFLGLLLINAAIGLGGPYLAWWFAADGRKAKP